MCTSTKLGNLKPMANALNTNDSASLPYWKIKAGGLDKYSILDVREADEYFKSMEEPYQSMTK